MNDPWSTVHDEVQMHPDFVQGQRYFRQGKYDEALSCFKSASQVTSDMHAYASLYMSFVGLTQVMLGDVSGLNLCRRAGQEETHRGDVFENLARAELRLGHRKQACEALRRGIKADRAHSGLRNLRTEMGMRRSPPLNFLKRDNPLNRMLGKLMYRNRRGPVGR
ncbi:MAG: tetratricopeptide repeat protein [Gammaproteobacteria bacterium]|nr:tetratricopeptide repeat protein [Gammaproteobacteria bacterium]